MSYKILIVDDEPVYLQRIFEIISKVEPDFEVFRSIESIKALTIAQTELPDLIISDWEMPVMNGIELVKALKQNELLKDIPVIMCTGAMTSSQNLKTALEAGAIDYIRKPIDEIELIARVKAAILLIEAHKKNKKQQRIIFSQEKRQIEQALEEKNKELVSYALMYAKHELNSKNIIQGIEEIRNSTKNEQITANLQQVIAQINANIHTDYWMEFKLYFEQVHNSFFTKLTQSYPNLTTNDLKLAAYLRLKMSTKEIAQITGQSTRALEVARYRLRQKLQLKKEDKLFDFLMALQ